MCLGHYFLHGTPFWIAITVVSYARMRFYLCYFKLLIAWWCRTEVEFTHLWHRLPFNLLDQILRVNLLSHTLFNQHGEYRLIVSSWVSKKTNSLPWRNPLPYSQHTLRGFDGKTSKSKEEPPNIPKALWRDRNNWWMMNLWELVKEQVISGIGSLLSPWGYLT